MKRVTEDFVKDMNTVMKYIYNMGLEDFTEFFNESLGYESNKRYSEEQFTKMRKDFFLWWCFLDTMLQCRMVEKIIGPVLFG